MKWNTRMTAMVLIISIVSMVTGGCAGKKKSYDPGKKAITVATNSESGGLDPAGMIAITYLAYSVTALDELLTFDAEGKIEYRGAVSYEVNDEATRWIFHLRKDAKWSDGTQVVAADYLNTIKRSLDPSSGNGYSNYLFPIKNAEDIYNQKKDMEDLGAVALDDYTLEFTLQKPCVYFLDLLRLPVYTPSCRQYADAVGSGWDKNPEKSLSNGPFCLKEYVSGQYFTLKKNPYYWDRNQVHLDEITYQFFDDQQSMELAYKTGEIDVATGLGDAVMQEYKDQKDLVLTNTIATRYIYPNLSVKPLDDVRVRKALNLSLNRKELCAMAGENTEPTVNFIAKYMLDKETGKSYVSEAQEPFKENVEEAQRLLSQAGYPNGKGFPTLTYNYPSLELDSDTAQIIQQQWKKNLNINIELKAQELQVNYSDRRAGKFDLCRMNWTADFADPNTYLSMLLSNSTYNCSGIADSHYDQMVNASDVERNVKKRNAWMHEAEQYAVGEQFYIIPLFAMKSCNLINPSIEGIEQIAASGAFDYRHVLLK